MQCRKSLCYEFKQNIRNTKLIKAKMRKYFMANHFLMLNKEKLKNFKHLRLQSLKKVLRYWV